MLADHAPIPTLAVADLDRARAFYEGVLHLAPKGEALEEGVFYGAGTGALFVYRSSFAGTNKATAVSFQVPPEAFDAEVAALRADGVTFLTFDMPGGTWEDGVALIEGQGKAVWFEDPDGNILNIDAMG